MTSTIALSWAEALLASLWQAPLVAALSWLLEHAWAERASTRHAIRASALLLVPLVAIATALQWLPGLGSWVVPTSVDAPLGDGLAVTSTLGTAPHPATSPGWVTWVLVVWLVGMLLMTARTARAWRAVVALRATAVPLPPEWLERVRTLALRMGMRAPAVAQSSACDSPLVLGLLRPLVLLPAGLVHGVSPQVIEAALAHELMHLRRLDPWLHAAQVAVEIGLFFNPAVWWMSWRLSREREHACDEAVLRIPAAPAPVAYARALLELEQWRVRPSPALALGLGGPSLRSRVLRLVQPRRARGARRWAARVGMLAVVGVLVVALERAEAPALAPVPSDAIGVAWLPASVRRHEPEIVRAAQRHGVDPALLAIVVHTESRGRPEARSSAGARGLMQLMPSTAAEIAERRGLPPPTPDALDEPAYNLDLGAWYLARLIEQHEGHLPLALAAYNAGPGRVAAYQRGELELPEETRRYQATIEALWRERWLPWSPTLASRHSGTSRAGER
ncbi:M56 family metallopeptidase [Paraliomyxa miuraensis]|uniref:M56 family metallopeptidase n=1 Tax=Paraliomyxa miuraensis TaxID=376150 RepID=UPI0022502763|nr:M56 family metallopeptidase [Paraliomyxa miuraensis]MCX4239589.1 transglycosylase SLT domain-containing protein [Paraliomyxa miuraensis]